MLVTYTLTRLYTLVMPVATAKGCHIVEFRGVQNMKMHGQFTTSDPELQAALEAQPEYRRGVYRISAKVGEAEADAQPPAATQPEAPSQQPSQNTGKTTTRKSEQKAPSLFTPAR